MGRTEYYQGHFDALKKHDDDDRSRVFHFVPNSKKLRKRYRYVAYTFFSVQVEDNVWHEYVTAFDDKTFAVGVLSTWSRYYFTNVDRKVTGDKPGADVFYTVEHNGESSARLFDASRRFENHELVLDVFKLGEIADEIIGLKCSENDRRELYKTVKDARNEKLHELYESTSGQDVEGVVKKLLKHGSGTKSVSALSSKAIAKDFAQDSAVYERFETMI